MIKFYREKIAEGFNALEKTDGKTYLVNAFGKGFNLSAKNIRFNDYKKYIETLIELDTKLED